MKRDELIKLLTDNFDADEDITFLINDSEYGETEEQTANVTTYEKKGEKGHWECDCNGKTYSSTSMPLLMFKLLKVGCSTKCGLSDYLGKNKRWVVDEVIDSKTKVLAIGSF